MTTDIAHRPANVMKAYTAQVRDHAAASQRLQDQYFAKLKRAEADYFDGVRRMAEAIMQETAPAEPVANGPTPNGSTAEASPSPADVGTAAE